MPKCTLTTSQMLDLNMQILLLLGLTTATWASLTHLKEQKPYDLSIQESVRHSLEKQRSLYSVGVNNQQQNCAPVQETYKKQFYIFSAPDEDFEDQLAAQKMSSTLQSNVRVVLIHAPEQKGLEHAALHLAKQAAHDKTAIYVLSKQHDVGELANRLTAYREQYANKPEVNFVKYRTAADAEHAQQQIQAHYDGLRGTSHISNEGAAPVLDFSTKKQLSYGSLIPNVPTLNSISSNNAGLYGQQVVNSAHTLPNIESLSVQSAAGYDKVIKQQPNYGSAISIVPAYNSVSSNNDDLYDQQVVNSAPTLPNIENLSLPSAGYDKATYVNLVNFLNMFKTQTYNTNSISSSNIGSYSSTITGVGNTADLNVDYDSTGIAAAGGFPGYSSSTAENNAGIASFLKAFGVSPRNTEKQRQAVAESTISRPNERMSVGTKLVFPSDGGSTNNYIPLTKRPH